VEKISLMLPELPDERLLVAG